MSRNSFGLIQKNQSIKKRWYFFIVPENEGEIEALQSKLHRKDLELQAEKLRA